MVHSSTLAIPAAIASVTGCELPGRSGTCTLRRIRLPPLTIPCSMIRNSLLTSISPPPAYRPTAPCPLVLPPVLLHPRLRLRSSSISNSVNIARAIPSASPTELSGSDDLRLRQRKPSCRKSRRLVADNDYIGILLSQCHRNARNQPASNFGACSNSSNPIVP